MQSSVQAFFPDALSRAEFLDKAVRGDSANNPLTIDQNQGAPCARLISRVWLNTVDATAAIPTDAPITSVQVLEVPPDRTAEALTAFDELDTRHRSIGGNPLLWRVSTGGTGVGRYVRIAPHESYEDLAAFSKRNAVLEPLPPPLTRAQAAGVMRLVSWSTTQRVVV